MWCCVDGQACASGDGFEGRVIVLSAVSRGDRRAPHRYSRTSAPGWDGFVVSLGIIADHVGLAHVGNQAHQPTVRPGESRLDLVSERRGQTQDRADCDKMGSGLIACLRAILDDQPLWQCVNSPD